MAAEAAAGVVGAQEAEGAAGGKSEEGGAHGWVVIQQPAGLGPELERVLQSYARLHTSCGAYALWAVCCLLCASVANDVGGAAWCVVSVGCRLGYCNDVLLVGWLTV